MHPGDDIREWADRIHQRDTLDWTTINWCLLAFKHGAAVYEPYQHPLPRRWPPRTVYLLDILNHSL